MEQQLTEFQADDFQAYFVIWEADVGGTPPNSTYCAQTRDDNGLTMPVLFDATGALAAAGLNHRHYHWVLEEGATIYFSEQFGDSGWRPAVREVLSR